MRLEYCYKQQAAVVARKLSRHENARPSVSSFLSVSFCNYCVYERALAQSGIIQFLFIRPARQSGTEMRFLGEKR